MLETAPRESLGRYVLLERLGAGAMGVVWAAYDPQLDRRVALKVLKTAAWSEGSEGRALLLREARAMAVLSHPHVVAVHDAGESADQTVFIAMELVDGPTLKAWLAAKKRPVRELLDVFAQAGRGLAAAHQAGLVHRDFKPDNVLIDSGGRVRVTDFGLARRAGKSEGLATPGSLDSATEGLVGTPRYMSPEAFLEQRVDERSDQFSFCVALHEALFHERPFEGESLEALTFAVTMGKRRPSPSGPVPSRVRKAIDRGLSVDPGARFPSMDALLAELSPRRTPPLVSVAALSVVVLASGGYVLRREVPCQGAAARLATVWNAQKREQVKQGLLATNVPFAAVAAEGVSTALDQHGAAWVTMHTGACEATRVRGEQSEAALQLRMNCLEQRLTELSALTNLLVQADAQLAEKAVQATRALTSLEGCADLQALTQLTPPPEAKWAPEVDRLRRQVAEVKALKDAARYKPGLELAESTVTAARAVPYPPLLGEALFQLGDLRGRAGDAKAAEATIVEASNVAELGRHDELRAQAATELVWYVGSRLGRHADGLRLADQGEAIIGRLGPRDHLHGRLLNYRGVVLRGAGRFEEARVTLEKALATLSSTLPAGHTDIGSVNTNLGLVVWQQGDFEKAIERHRAALAINEAALGNEHPALAVNLNNLCVVFKDMGRFPEGIELGQRALELRERTLGKEHVQLTSTLNNLGETWLQMGELELARAAITRAVALREKAGKHPDLASILCSLGELQLAKGEIAAAQQTFQRAETIVLEQGPEHPQLSHVYSGQGQLHFVQGDPVRAEALLQRSLVIHRKAQGEGHPEEAPVLLRLGRVLAALKRDDEARSAFEAGLAVRKGKPTDPTLLGQLELGLARLSPPPLAATLKAAALEHCAVFPRGKECK